jgi:riboflavin kinase/FMN adenylyltransferase
VLVEEELARFTPTRDTLLTIGVFDGVHRGHQRLIEELKRQAAADVYLAGVVTFHQHPEEVLAPGKNLPFLTDIQTRIKLLKAEGVAIIVPLSFTAELARLGARRFVGLLKKHLRMRGLVIGADFALGQGRRGTPEALKNLGKEMGFNVTVVPPLRINGEVVSSTTIRQAMAAGDMEKVRTLTGRYFSLHGRVIHGEGRGEGLGFPTANLNISPGQSLPPDGVYAALAHANGHTYPSMSNIGRNPTFGDNERSVEAYLFDYGGDLYGHELKVDFVARLRDEKKFTSADDLKQQVAEDVKKGKAILDKMGVEQP